MKRTLVILLLTFVVSLFSVSIYDIQFTDDAGDGTYPSTMADQDVTVTGIVTASGYAGDKYFVCDLPEVGTGAWHGIYVYNTDPEQTPQLGDIVDIAGTVSEYFGVTEIGYATTTVVSSGNDVPAPTNVSTLNLVVPAMAEAFEGCLVVVSNVTVVEAQNDYGEWYITDGEGDCQVDDGFFYLDEVDPAIEIAIDDTWGTIIGILDYSYDFYGLNPRFPEDMMANVEAPTSEVNAIATLDGNYPNPFNPTTTVKFSMEESANVSIDIYNIKGRKVKTLVNDIQSAGSHTEIWNGTNDSGEVVGSGIYFMKMKAGNVESTKKMVLMK